MSRHFDYSPTEYFTYDNLDRLISADNINMTYAANGNITNKLGIGNYTYMEVSPTQLARLTTQAD